MNRSVHYTITIILVLLIAGLLAWIYFGPLTRIDQQRSDLQQKIEKLKTENQDLQSRLDDAQKQLKRLREQNREIASKFRENVGEAPVRRENRQVILQLSENILFELGSATIKSQGKEILGKVASVLKEYPDREIRIEGHADTLPIKTDRYPSNWELSGQRAINVLKYLVYTHGIGKERIGATAFGQFRPLVPNSSEENRQQNRRVEIVLFPNQFNQKTLDAMEADTINVE